MKKTLKIMALIIAIIMLFSTCVFADEEVAETPSVISAPVEEGTMDDVPLLISTNDDEDSQTTDSHAADPGAPAARLHPGGGRCGSGGSR